MCLFYHTEYALQRKPVTFTTSPQSQDIFSQDNLTLHCNVTLWSKSIVLLRWRHNGQELINDIEGSVSLYDFIQDEVRIMSSELQIQNVSLAHEGEYECLALDGVDTNENAAMITASKSAQIRILGNV